MIERLESRRWLVDELRLIAPPQHFMTRKTSVDQRRAVSLLLEQNPENPLHLYVHVPFCEEHCTFCMYFHRGAKQGSDRVQAYATYLSGLLTYLERELNGRPLRALYVGGGTASILTIEQIQALFSPLAPHLHPQAETTFEMSPRSSTPAKLEALRALGFNRFSFGLQTFSEPLLRSMHRAPASLEQMATLLDCAKAFGQVNVDLMVGVENEGPNDLYASAELLFALRPHSVSVYRESRPRPGRADLANGVGAFLRDVVQPRVARTAELARACGYYVPDDLATEHVRFIDMAWTAPAVPAECRYRTRYDPYHETTLVGIGPSTFSFCGGKLYVVNDSLQEHEITQQDLGKVFVATTDDIGAAVAVNLLYHGGRHVDLAMFRKTVGVGLDDLFAEELTFLEEAGLIRRSAEEIERTCDDPARWAYSDKILYPERWVKYTQKHGF
jgi:coproporphyrinogen III oxidase-like Fe-S oxidoreductase